MDDPVSRTPHAPSAPPYKAFLPHILLCLVPRSSRPILLHSMQTLFVPTDGQASVTGRHALYHNAHHHYPTCPFLLVARHPRPFCLCLSVAQFGTYVATTARPPPARAQVVAYAHVVAYAQVMA
jgi:hypothetical protein